MNRYILKTDQYSFGWSDNTYKKVENQKALIIYHDGKLYFRSYSIALPILDFSLLFTEATNTDIDNVFGKPLFNGTDCEWMKANSDSVMRKQIKSIENSKILTKQNITSNIFRS